MIKFNEFIDKKGRAAKKQLGIIKKILESHGLAVVDLLGEEEPYVFLMSPDKQLSFRGIRIYKVGNDLAYRVQKEEKTHPYGKSYLLDVEGMFNDLITDKGDEEKAGHEVIEAVAQEMIRFFRRSAEAERELRASEFSTAGDPLSRVMDRSTPKDYANITYSPNTTSPL